MSKSGRIYLVRINHIRSILPTSISLAILCGQNRPDMIDSDHITICSNTSDSMQSESTRYDCESNWTEITVYGHLLRNQYISPLFMQFLDTLDSQVMIKMPYSVRVNLKKMLTLNFQETLILLLLLLILQLFLYVATGTRSFSHKKGH